jgi:hypothetical protein
MCGADLLVTHVYFFPSYWGGPPAGSPKNRYPICGFIWQCALGRSGEKPCVSPAGMRMGCAAGSWNWSTFSINVMLICIVSETFLNLGQAFRLASYVCHRKTD